MIISPSAASHYSVFDNSVNVLEVKNKSLELSPAITSIALFSRKAKNCDRRDNFLRDTVKQCIICSAQFGLDQTKAVPKILPCGHNFCSECIFSMCLHREYYLLDSINCPKCGKTCEARKAMKAPINYELCKILNNGNINDSSSNITVIKLDNEDQTPHRKRSKLAAQTALSSPFLVKGQRKKRSKMKPTQKDKPKSSETKNGYLSSVPEDPLPNEKCLEDRNILEKVAQMSALNDARLQPQLCKNNVVYDHCNHCNYCSNNKQNTANTEQINMEEYCHKDVPPFTQCMCFQQEIAYISKKFDKMAKRFYRETSKLESKWNHDCEIDFLPKNNFSNIINAFLKAKKVLIKETCSLTKSDGEAPLNSVNQAILNRIENLYDCFIQKIDLKYFELCLAAVPDNEKNLIVTSLLTIRICIETILLLRVSTVMEKCSSLLSTAERQNFLILRKCMNELQEFCEEYREYDETLYSTLKNCANCLTVLLNENCAQEIILFMEIAFINIFRLLKRFSRFFDYTQICVRDVQLWKMAQTAFSELLRISSLHWKSSDSNRIGVVNSMASMCVLFADICDVATVLVCMIEAARARASISQLLHNSSDELTLKINDVEGSETMESRKSNENRAKHFDESDSYCAHLYLKEIDNNLIECRRIQKLSKLRSRTKILKKIPTATVAPSTNHLTNNKTRNSIYHSNTFSAITSPKKAHKQSRFLRRLFGFKT